MLELIFNNTITLFNRHEDAEDTLIWRPTTISNVHCVADRAKIISMYGENATDNVMLHIMYERSGADIVIGDKRYLLPKTYAAMATSEIGWYFTFQLGDRFDFFMEGEWDGAEVIADDDYNSGFYNYMNKTHDGVYAITSCSRYALIPHFELLAR